jgi:iron complex transport system ATP-binding protein
LSADQTTVFEVRDLTFRYETAQRPALADVSLRIGAGGLYAIIGPNGSGKSTLLKLLLGALDAGSGEVLYQERRVADWGRRTLAQSIGVVPQGEELAFPLSVEEMVAMGRYPYLGILGRPGPADREAIREAMERCDVLDLADRPISKLSGGERQLTLVARALAQRPSTLVLDEPTVSLDIAHEMTILELLAELARRDGVTVVLVTHNLNLAARYADRLLLLDAGTPAAEGVPRDVLTRETIERVYGWPVDVREYPGPGRDRGAPQVISLSTLDTRHPTPDIRGNDQ